MTSALPDHKEKLLLLENSRDFTGAFACALQLKEALKDHFDIEFVMSSDSRLIGVVFARGIICHTLPMMEIGRSLKKILYYLPVLIINAIRLHRLLARRKASILLVNDYYNLLGVSVKALGWRGRLLTMVRLMPQNQNIVFNWMWVTLGKIFSDYLIAVSKAVAKQLPKHERVVVIYDPFSTVERYPAYINPQGLTSDSVYCLYVANYIPGKGQDTALEAFYLAWRQVPRLRLRFIGGDMGIDRNKAFKAYLRERVNSLGMERVVTLDGFSNDVEREIKNSDIVLNFSSSESFSRTCAEASSFRRPIIATRCGGPEEIVDDGVTGFLIECGDIVAMARAMVILAETPSLRMAMGRAGYRLITTRFSEEVYKLRFLRLFPKCQY